MTAGWIDVLILCGPCWADRCWDCEGGCPCDHPPLDNDPPSKRRYAPGTGDPA